MFEFNQLATLNTSPFTPWDPKVEQSLAIFFFFSNKQILCIVFEKEVIVKR